LLTTLGLFILLNWEKGGSNLNPLKLGEGGGAHFLQAAIGQWVHWEADSCSSLHFGFVRHVQPVHFDAAWIDPLSIASEVNRSRFRRRPPPLPIGVVVLHSHLDEGG